MTIKYYANIGHSPAWHLIPVAMTELYEQGFSVEPNQPPMWDDPCLIEATTDGKVKGFIIYRPDPVRRSWYVMLAYVAHDYRRRGVHTRLFEKLVERATERGDIMSIDCGTHANNTPAQHAFEHQGRELVGYIYQYHIREYVDGKNPLEIEHA